ncbi:MAG: MBL fold metallo-hydrolase [Phycisphaerales bacterium]
MQIRVIGAAGEVTGSCYIIETGQTMVMLDFGLFQGPRELEELNRNELPIDPSKLDAVLLTHAHLDHSGRLPMLAGTGFNAPIYATGATIELSEILLRDSAHIQLMDAKRAARRKHKRSQIDMSPLYTTEDVDAIMPRFASVEYDEPFECAPGIVARYVDAGHILGSASIELTITEGSETKTVVFSGDIGPNGVPLLRDPVKFEHADLVFLESTYGDRDHRPLEDSVEEFAKVIEGARSPRGKVLIPSFAVGRTQQLIYYMGELIRSGRLQKTEVVVDSPMATSTTELYRNHRKLFDDESWAIIEAGDMPLQFEGLRFTQDVEESIELNTLGGGIVIVSASGMCTGGRIVHHLRHGLRSDNTHVVFVGYQARGTLGRLLVDGRETVKILGDEIHVEANIHTIGGFSAHAGQTGLIEWMNDLAKSKPRVVLTHGENDARKELAKELQSRFGIKAEMPGLGEVVKL